MTHINCKILTNSQEQAKCGVIGARNKYESESISRDRPATLACL